MTSPGGGEAFPAEFFERADASSDEQFYVEPRFVTHIDDATIEALTRLYGEVIAPGSDVLDLMSSWISHLPDTLELGHVAGLGMNERELSGNPRLTEHTVHDLNERPELPYEDESFDFVINAVSVQYLTRPREVFASVRRVLRPGGAYYVAISHRMFPTKAVAVWQSLTNEDRVRLVAAYFNLAGGYEEPELIDRSPAGADPLWVIFAKRAEDG